MKFKKIFFFTIYLCFFSNSVFSQSWFTSEVSYANVNTLSFYNANTGFAGVLHGGLLGFYKTTNKGQNWSLESYVGSSSNFASSIAVPSLNNIFAYQDRVIYNSTNGGANWNSYVISQNDGSRSILIRFKDQNTGFFAYTNVNNDEGAKIFRTTNGGGNWNQVVHYDKPPVSITYTYIIKDFAFSEIDPNLVTMVGYRINTSGNLLTSISAYSNDGGANWSSLDFGAQNADLDDPYHFMSFVDQGNGTICKRILKTLFEDLSSTNGAWCVIDNNGSVTEAKICDGNFATNDIGGINFINYNTGYCVVSDKLFKTTNSGYNWSQELGFLSEYRGNNNNVITFGDVVYTFNEELLQVNTLGTSLITTFDGVGGNGSLAFDGENYSTPSSHYLRGGFSEIYANPILQNSSLSNTDAIFYKWSNGYMPHIRANEEYLYPGSFTADYKTKKYSTTSSSISNVTQRRSFRDVNGNVNTIHSSMDGGIFFTKSTNNGSSFIKEEIVTNRSGQDEWTTNNNINPFLNEVKVPSSYLYSSEKTPVVTWERREGNTIKILTANRWKSADGSYYWWETDPEASFDITGVTDQDFKAYPKVFSQVRELVPSGSDTTFKYFYAIPYLKPDVSGSKLVVKVINQVSSTIDREDVIATGNISDVSIEGDFNIPSGNLVDLDLHITYKKDNKIYYRKENYEYVSTMGGNTILWTTDPSPFEVSSADGLGSRYTPDISLSNGNPVIAYRGSKTTLKTVVWYDSGPSEPVIDEINIAKNPIYIRKKSSSGQWGNFEIYNSNGSEAQLNPDVEGSKDADAHLIGFSVGNPSSGAMFKKFVKIEGQSGYNCDPGIFNGNDAMFVKGSYTGTTGSTSYPMLWTSKSENSLYKIDKQSFVISNMISTPDSYNNLAGVVGMEGLDYTFTLGPIFAASTIPALDPKDAPTHISSFIEFNENMVSAPFVMSDLDTLILGAAGSYTPSSESAFSNTIRYDVNLLYASTGNLHRLLFTDTVHAGDSLEPEFLRGFIIDNIPNGSDSFYVQLALYEDDLNDGDYTLNGVYMGGDGDGDNSGYKTMVFFEGDNPLVGNQSFIPKEYALNQNYPNPFNPSTTISYDIPTDGLVKMKIYDLAGREVKTLVNELKTAGRYTVSFNGSSLSSGVYFYRIESGSFVQTKKMLLVK